ncbi:MAG: D-alanine--D-alanine ligase [Clostridia bacterium]|nr:D-alanine--D-alanine ligase [Clostridia bacterium]
MLNLCCLFGGESTEYEVSLRSVTSVIENADPAKYTLTTVGITRDGKWYLYNGPVAAIAKDEWWKDETYIRPAMISPSKGDRCLLVLEGTTYRKIPLDVVFPVMHGAHCEDGTLQGLLELSGIPFVGPDCRSSAVCIDKFSTKAVLNNFKIPQARVEFVTRRELAEEFDAVAVRVAALGYPVFVKPSATGSSIGVSKVRTPDALQDAIANAARFDDVVLVEEFIDGREIEVAIMGNDAPVASVCGEIDPGSDFYDYETKYVSDTASYYIPARLSNEASDAIRKTACEIYRRLGCAGLSRVDFFYTADGRYIFNEINTLPGFTSISMYPKLFMACGMTYAEVIDRLVEHALAR